MTPIRNATIDSLVNPRELDQTTSARTTGAWPAITDYDVIVIGAGLAGLETAALLAQQGARVLVLERRPVIGGRAMVVRDAGFTLNYGLHYMMHGYANPHYRILEAVGKAGNVGFAPINTRQIWRMRGGRLHLVPATMKGMLTTRLLNSHGKVRLLGALRSIMQANPEELWQTPLGVWLDRVAPEPTLRTFFLDAVRRS